MPQKAANCAMSESERIGRTYRSATDNAGSWVFELESRSKSSDSFHFLATIRNKVQQAPNVRLILEKTCDKTESWHESHTDTRQLTPKNLLSKEQRSSRNGALCPRLERKQATTVEGQPHFSRHVTKNTDRRSHIGNSFSQVFVVFFESASAHY